MKKIKPHRYIQWQGSTLHDQSPKNRETKPDIGSHTRSNRKNTTRTSEIQIKTFKILMQLIIYNLEQIRVKKHHQKETSRKPRCAATTNGVPAAAVTDPPIRPLYISPKVRSYGRFKDSSDLRRNPFVPRAKNEQDRDGGTQVPKEPQPTVPGNKTLAKRILTEASGIDIQEGEHSFDDMEAAGAANWKVQFERRDHGAFRREKMTLLNFRKKYN
ncbi:hypothetical protein YC2023_040085 [Brassica napus]